MFTKKLYLQENFLNNYVYKLSPKIKFFSIVLALIFLLIAFLEPRGFGYDKAKTTSGNTIFVLDVTKSMNALDYRDDEKKNIYSKLDTAKKIILDIVEENKENNYGLLVFAGEPRVMSPLTTDENSFKNLLIASDSNSVKTNGTDITSALNRAIDMFKPENKAKNIILLTDGGEEKNDFQIINNTIKQENIKLLTIGLGNKQGSFIPDYTNPFGEIVYKKYNGKKVVTFLNSGSLNNLEGEYKEFLDFKNLDKLKKEIISANDKLLNDYFLKDKKNLTRIFVMFSFVLFCFYLIIDLFDKKRQKLI
ncbi:MAG: VWA domain-containing protein [Candidatus Gracilibacteria bacterium]|nr:VWA domain-containing protein [Candidatus Gracilibacteria bacterium]